MADGKERETGASLRVTVLAGGPSRERAVSLNSGHAVAQALTAAGLTVTVADISPEDLSALDIPADVIFPVLHGRFGEDGELQTILETRGLTYCGSGPQGCRLAMNKYHSKQKMVELGVPTPGFDVVQDLSDVSRAKACWSIPVVVKPVDEGSSLGVTIVQEADQLDAVIRQTFTQFGTTLVEEFIAGRELTVGLLANRALPILEISSNRPFYDYQAKYTDPDTRYTFVRDLPADLSVRMQDWSVQVAVGLGLRDFCRVDWRLDNAGRPYCLEVNAIPGFTDHSLLPKAAGEAGYSMVELCRSIVELAWARNKAPAKVPR